MNRLCHYLVVVTAAAGALTLGCGRARPAESPQSTQARTHVHAHHHHGHHHQDRASLEEADRCAAHITGTAVSVEDTPQGARLLYRTDSPAYVRALRDAAHHQAQAPVARPAAATLSNAQVELPPVTTTIEYTAEGAIVSYRAIDPKHVDRVRLLVHWDAAAQRLGSCSILKTPPDSMAATHGKPAIVARASGGGQGEWITNVEIDPDLGATCGIAPDQLSFPFDSSEARPRAFPALRLLSNCIDQGPVAGMKLTVIGYASPDDAYAEQTGWSRAEAIADYITSQGAPRASVTAWPDGDPKWPGSHAALRVPGRSVVIKAAK